MSRTYDRNEIAQQIIGLIARQLRREPSTIHETSTIKDLGADSLDMVEIIIQLEDHFGIQINDEKAEQMNSVQELINYVYTVCGKSSH